MTDFFEKIKKGMDSDNSSVELISTEPEELEEPIEELSEELTEEPIEPVEESSVELTSFEINEPEEPTEEIKKKPQKKASKKKSVKKTAKKSVKKSTEKAIEEKPVKKIEIKTEEEPISRNESDHKRIEETLFDGPEGELTVDVYQSGNDLIVRSAIAGVDPEDLDITIENDLVIISGQREQNNTEEKDNYFFQECYWGRFRREIILPLEVDSSRANAKMEKGVLIIKIPIIEERKKKTKISIE